MNMHEKITNTTTETQDVDKQSQVKRGCAQRKITS